MQNEDCKLLFNGERSVDVTIINRLVGLSNLTSLTPSAAEYDSAHLPQSSSTRLPGRRHPRPRNSGSSMKPAVVTLLKLDLVHRVSPKPSDS